MKFSLNNNTVMCKAAANISCALVILCCYICKQMGERSSRKEKESVLWWKVAYTWRKLSTYWQCKLMAQGYVKLQTSNMPETYPSWMASKKTSNLLEYWIRGALSAKRLSTTFLLGSNHCRWEHGPNKRLNIFIGHDLLVSVWVFVTYLSVLMCK